MSKENLNLPWHHEEAYSIHESDNYYQDKIGKCIFKCYSNSDEQFRFLLKAVNSFHEREEIIKELIEVLSNNTGNVFPTKETYLLDKARKILNRT